MPAGLHFHRLRHALDDLRIHADQLTAGLGIDLDAAGALEGVHRQEGVGDGLAGDQQAVVAQHQEVRIAQVGLQARLLFVAEGHAFVVVIGQRSQHEGGLLVIGRMPHFCALTATPARVCVCSTHWTSSRASCTRAVDDEAGRVDREGRVDQLVALLVDLHQRRGGDLVEHQAVGIDQEVVLGAGHARADVREDQVAPAVERDQPVAGGQVHAQLPFLGADDFLQRCDVHAVSLFRVPTCRWYCAAVPSGGAASARIPTAAGFRPGRRRPGCRRARRTPRCERNAGGCGIARACRGPCRCGGRSSGPGRCRAAAPSSGWPR